MLNFMLDPTGDAPWEEDPAAKNVVQIGTEKVFLSIFCWLISLKWNYYTTYELASCYLYITMKLVAFKFAFLIASKPFIISLR